MILWRTNIPPAVISVDSLKIKTKNELNNKNSNNNNNISNFQVPRRKGGIAIIWPKSFGKLMKRLEDGNERIQAVELNAGGH